ncbi:MAG: hypothetical protein WD152_06325 [Nitriliruptoraceae bacterium]
MRRLLSLATGIGMGAFAGAVVMRRIESARRAVSPSSLTGGASRLAGDLGGKAEAWRARVRAEALEVEAELRATFDVPDLNGAAEHGSEPTAG